MCGKETIRMLVTAFTSLVKMADCVKKCKICENNEKVYKSTIIPGKEIGLNAKVY